MKEHIVRIGVVGTGFIATGLNKLIQSSKDFQISKVLTRRPIDAVKDFPEQSLTNSISELVESSDIVFECSGDAIHATEAVLEATKAKRKVVTVDSEFQVTTGSYFVRQGAYITEADGDRPGCLARLKAEIEGMGFEAIAYVNLKGFLNPNPSLKDMQYWSEKQQLRLEQVVSFTDGTKLQIEQALVANGLGATIAQNGMIGARVEHLNDLDFLVRTSEEVGSPISDYVLAAGAPPGVLILAKNKEADRLEGYLPFSRLRTREGLAYMLLRPHHLCYLEALNTLRKIVLGEQILLNNSANPTIAVAAVAKRKIGRDEIIERGAGGFDVRGMALRLRENIDAVPICLLKNTRIVKEIEPGQIVRFEDVELAETKALEVYRDLLNSLINEKDVSPSSNTDSPSLSLAK
ncbi:MAG: hypothetical protein MUE44_27050 [Oscillatoriaceae cyanobacterium Prado104]|jgi:predicted homoserine dehydrogenase-like protein|nr:hypothetical protein [Oscillatoriaceae cyanobacterium Prado104]